MGMFVDKQMFINQNLPFQMSYWLYLVLLVSAVCLVV